MPKPAKSCMDPPEWRICRAEGTSTWQNRFLVERPWKKERQMENARASLLSFLTLLAVAACTPYDAPDKPYVTDQRTTEPIFVSTQPLALPHPTGCWRCGFSDGLAEPRQ
jgi:hypothetical protein